MSNTPFYQSRLYSCCCCQIEFKDILVLHNHSYNKYLNQNGSIDEAGSIWVCYGCMKYFKTFKSYKKHLHSQMKYINLCCIQ